MTRRARSLALSLVLPLAVLGCGDGGGTDEVTVDATPDGLARAASRTIDGESGRFLAEITMAGGPIDASFSFAGAYDAAGRSEVEIDFGGLLGGLPGGEEAPAGLDAPMRMVLDGSTMYLCGPLVAFLGADGECGSIDVEAIGLPAVSGPADPTAFLRTMAGSDDVEEVGAEDVEGVATTHFRGTYTMRDAIDALEPEQAEDLEQQLEGLGGGDELLDVATPFDVWVDGDGRVRRMTFELAVPTPEGGGDTQVRVTTDLRFSDFGDDVEIDVPEGATDITDALEGAGGLTG